MKHLFQLILAVVLGGSSLTFAEGNRPQVEYPRGEPQNAWRYQFYNGRWWFWTPDDRWAYYNGRKWLTLALRPAEGPATVGQSSAAKIRGPRGGGTYSTYSGTQFYGPAGSRLPSPGGDAASPPLSGSSSRVFGGSSTGIAPEAAFGGTRSRSGDAGSGVGGGAVGGTTITGGPGTGPAK